MKALITSALRQPSIRRPASDPWSPGLRTAGRAAWGTTHTLSCSAQNLADDEAPFAPTMAGQLRQAFRNLQLVLRHAGYALTDVVRLNLYTPDAGALIEHYDAWARKLARAGICPDGVVIAVPRLAHPDMLVEVEMTAIR